ncbi:hypothetical protein [Deinococcus hopiensis]|uniref:hypothetical protein n=1 Tax=Deinococcus hopiensis TaxID=309885 RepID=UPI000A02444C|nr:hypothetical protein [Deinococcus hopiensis]
MISYADLLVYAATLPDGLVDELSDLSSDGLKAAEIRRRRDRARGSPNSPTSRRPRSGPFG